MALYHSAKGPVNYTVVGSPTITDGVVNNIGVGNYLLLNTAVVGNTVSEICFKIKLSNPAAYNGYLFSSSNGISIEANDGKVSLTGSFSGSGRDIITGMVANTWYYGKVVLKTSTAETYMSTDGINWSAVSTLAKPDLTGNYNFYIGRPAWGNPTDNYYFKGDLDLKETYITVNSQPWFGVCPVEVKKHQLMGPVGYTVVGSPTITDGIVSNLSTNNYLSVSAPANTLNNNFDIIIKINRSGTLPSEAAYFFSIGQQLLIYQQTTGSITMRCRDSNDATKYVGVASSGNTNPFIKVEYRSNKVSTYTSADGVAYTLYSEDIFDTKSITTSEYVNFGQGVFGGSIDLNQTYIKVNGKLWFYQPAPTKYIIHEDKDTNNQSLVFASQDLYLSGPVNYTKVGSPTIVDGVLSNCSSSNHIKLNSPLDYSKDMEIVFKLRFEDSYTQEAPILQDLKVISGINNGMSIHRNEKRRISFLLSKGYSEGGTWNSFNYDQFPLEEWFYVKFTITSDTMTLYTGSSLDSLTQVATTTRLGTTTGIDNPLIGYSHYWGMDQMFNEGQIDLKESYIKIDGSLWFYGKNYATQNIAPVPAGYHTKGQVGCVAVGSPTITDGVVSGFSSSNYIQTDTNFDPSNPFIFVVKATMPAQFPSSPMIIAVCSGFLRVSNTGDLAFIFYPDGGSSVNITAPQRIAAGNTYYIKVTKSATGVISLSFSTDNETYVGEVSTSSPLPTSANRVVFGYNSIFAPMSGSIDLNETYIKVNNEMWFDGKGQYPFTGYVDMRTQAFTAAPTGATIGRDE